MIIGGMRKLSTLDYPTRLCVTVFTKGCNFRCPFCHNSSLVLKEKFDCGENICQKDIFEFLKKRKGLLDALCLTGGEPLINDISEIINFLPTVKEQGFLVKLDTNGSYPEKLSLLIKENLVDFVAMDIKNSLSKYGETVGIDVKTEDIQKSVGILMNGNVDFEFRTTVVKNLHDEESMKEIGKWLEGTEKYYLQMFVPSENTIKQGYEPYTANELENLRRLVLPYIPNTFLRGV